MFDADRPILSHEQDRLGRSDFSKYLARCILDHKSPESLVIGLEGGWGTGKTSIINLVLEELRYASNNMFDDEKPIILNFSPWSYSGQNQLIYGFFRRLSSELRQCSYLENANQIIHLLELYVSFFTHQPVPKSLRIKNHLLKASKQESYAWESGRDPIQVKTELNDLLRKQKHKIIIVIDNVSRLEAMEINQILQIVKSMGDYVNTIYMLSFDKEQVINAINTVHVGEGADYLDKLVQLPFEVPPISKQDLENLLVDRLQGIIRFLPEGLWSHSYWADIYYSALKYFFNNSRDITRYVNTLGFSFQYVKDVVNPVDFFALSAIEVFEPHIFNGIRDNKDLFTDLLDNVFVLDEDKINKDKLRCDEILQRGKNVPQDVLLKLLIQVFPRLRGLYFPGEAYYHSEAIARKNLRACSPDVFDIYFRFSIPSDYMSESEMETLLELSGDEEGFSQVLLRLNQDNRVTRFLSLLDGNVSNRIYKQHIKNVICALMNCGDLFPDEKTTALSLGTDMRVHRICHQLLHRFASMEERFEIFLEAINKATNSLHIIVSELNLQAKQHIETEDVFLPQEHRDFTQEQLRQLREAAVAKIKYWASIGRLAEHPKLLDILYAWKDWGNDAEVREFVLQMIQDDRGLLEFLGTALKIPVDQTAAKLEKDPQWIKYLDNITDFISLDLIEPRAKQIFEDDGFEKLREHEQLSVLIFLDMINAETLKVIPKTSG